MPYAPITIPVFAVHGLLSGAQKHWDGREYLIEEVVSRSGISRDLLDEPGARVTAEQYVKLYALLIDALDDEAIALLSRRLRPGTFALIARSILGAKTVEAAVRRVARALTLVQDDLVFACAREGELSGLVCELRTPESDLPVFAHELLMRVCWRLIAWMLGSGSRPTRFEFSFERPYYAQAYEAIFPGRLHFGQARSAVWFESVELARPFRRSEQDLKIFLESATANVAVPGLLRVGTGAQVRAALERSMPDWPGLPDIARQMGMSTATLQRQLARERTSLRAIKEELRRDFAIMRLNTSIVPLSVIASELGFADSATFQRAFRIWTGSPPGRYRRRDKRTAARQA